MTATQRHGCNGHARHGSSPAGHATCLRVWSEASMKILTILGLSALGAAYYAHQRRGGVLTVDSIRDSARALGEWAKTKVSTAKDDVATAVDDDQIDDIQEVFP